MRAACGCTAKRCPVALDGRASDGCVNLCRFASTTASSPPVREIQTRVSYGDQDSSPDCCRKNTHILLETNFLPTYGDDGLLHSPAGCDRWVIRQHRFTKTGVSCPTVVAPSDG